MILCYTLTNFKQTYSLELSLLIPQDIRSKVGTVAVKKVKGCSPIISIVVLILFAINSSLPISSLAQTLPELSAVGVRVSLSPHYAPVILKGVKIHPENPLLFDFIVDNGDIDLKGKALTKETTQLVKYFLASLAVPKNDLWVNLSPYEKERMIPEAFSVTEMGHGLLAQDYLLKQITSSLIYPESDLGKQFWAKVYSRAQELYGTTQIPINTFNKVWIVPDKATVFQNNNAAFVVESHLKVLLEEDFLALGEGVRKDIYGARQLTDSGPEQVNRLSSQVVREVVIPVLEKEINEGKNFALLRQIYQSLILADWYKQALKTSLLGQVYAQSNKVKGIDDVAKGEKLKIYEQYLAAYKDGVYNTIKEEVDPATQTTVPRRYVSGGFSLGETNTVIVTPQTMTPIQNAYMVSSAGEPNTIQYNFQVVFPGAGPQSIGPEEQGEGNLRIQQPPAIRSEPFRSGDHFFLSEIDDVARILEMENGREQLIEIFNDSLPMEIFINNLAEAAGVPPDVIFQFMEAQRLIIQDSSADYVFSPGAFSNAKIRMFVSVQRFWNSQVREIAQFKNVLRRSVDASRLMAELAQVTGKKYQDVYQAVKGRLILDLVVKDHSASLQYALQLARKSWDNPDGEPLDLRRNFLVAVSLNDLVNELCRVFAVEQSKVLFELSQLNVWVDNHTASSLSPAIVAVQVRDDNYLTNQILRPQVMEELIERLTDEQTRPQWSVQKLEAVVRNVVDKEKLVDLISTRFSMGPQAVKAELVKFHIISADEGGLTNVQKDVFFLSELGEVARDLGILNKLEMLDEDYWGALPSYHWFKEEMARVSGLKREIVEKNLFKAGISKGTNIIEEFTFAQLAFVDVKIAKFNDLQKQSLADKKNIIFPENADQYRASLSLGLESFKRVLRNGVDEILLMGRVMEISRQKYAVVQDVLKKRLLIPDYEKDMAFTLEHSLRVKKSWNQQGDIDTLTLNSYLKAFDGEGFLRGLARAFKRRRSFMIAWMLELNMLSRDPERGDLFSRQIRGTAGQPVFFVTGHFFETNKILELIDRCVHANDRQEWSLHRYEDLINEQVNEAEFIRNLQAAITAPGNSEATIRKELLRVGLRLLIKSNEKSLLAQKYLEPLNVLEKQNLVMLQKFAEWTAQKEGKELDQEDILDATTHLLESVDASPDQTLALDYFHKFAKIGWHARLDETFRSIHFQEPSDFEQLTPEQRLFLRSYLRLRLIQATLVKVESSLFDNFMDPRMKNLERETRDDLKAWNELRGGAGSEFGIKDSFLLSNELAGAPQSILASPDSISARSNDTKGMMNNGKRSVGGIFLGSGQYLRVIEVNPDGQPVFDPKQFEEMRTNLLGIVPVPVSLPVPANILLLSGITGQNRSPVVGYEFKEKSISGSSIPQPAVVATRREDQV